MIRSPILRDTLGLPSLSCPDASYDKRYEWLSKHRNTDNNRILKSYHLPYELPDLLLNEHTSRTFEFFDSGYDPIRQVCWTRREKWDIQEL